MFQERAVAGNQIQLEKELQRVAFAHKIITVQDREHQEGTLASEVQLKVPSRQASFERTVPLPWLRLVRPPTSRMSKFLVNRTYSNTRLSMCFKNTGLTLDIITFLYECAVPESQKRHQLRSIHLPLIIVGQRDAQPQGNLASTSLHSLMNFLKAFPLGSIFCH